MLVAAEPSVLTRMSLTVAPLVADYPTRALWGTDWPHPRPEGPVPDAQRLIDVFLEWTPAPAVRQAILTDNPARLYDFPKV